MNARALLKSAVIFTITAVGLTVLIYHFATSWLDLLLPLYRAELHGLMSDFQIEHLTWELERGETVVRVAGSVIQYVNVGNRLLGSRITADASTLAAHAWAYPVLMLPLAAAWPGLAPNRRFILFVLVLAFAMIGTLLDVPLMLWGGIEDIVEIFQRCPTDPHCVTVTTGSRLQQFLEGGGRYALAFTLVWLAMGLSRIVAPSDHISPASPSSRDSKQ